MQAAIRKIKRQQASERRNFHLTDVPIIQQASAEVQKLSTALPDEEEAESLAVNRRYSHAPSIASSNHSTKDTKYTDNVRPPSRQFGRSTKREQDDEKSYEQVGREIAVKTSAVLPACIAACVPMLLNNCESTEVTVSNYSVGEIASYVVESCLIEDPTLFLRHLFEKLSGKEEKESETIIILRKLPSHLGKISPHVAHAIFANVLGIMIKAARSSIPGSDRNIIACIGVLTSICPFVEGLELKTLKMAMRKEQSELGLLTSSSLPAHTRLIIHSSGEHYVPTYVDMNEYTTFEHVIAEVMRHDELSEDDSAHYQLKDERYNFINPPQAFVRDVYFKKSDPKLSLILMDPEDADRQIKERTIAILLEEIQKLQFTIQLLVTRKCSEDRQVNASFLLEEFLRLQSFPRKAIQAHFEQFTGHLGRQIADLDMIHKYNWIEQISTVFYYLPTEFPWGDELMLFLNVWNAALVTHPLQKPILRRYGASVIDAAVQMNHQFFKTGYTIILPTILEVYGEYFNMPSVKHFVEFLCKQLHIIHRHPFVLELIASSLPVLSASSSPIRQKNLTAEKLFTLLLSLEQQHVEDRLEILEMVKADQPLRSFDFFYKSDFCSVTIIDCCTLCVTVIAACPESGRTLEMLLILEQIIPCYLKHIEKPKEEERNDQSSRILREISNLREVDVCIRSLLLSLECLTRNPSHQPPQHHPSQKVYHYDGAKLGGQGKYKEERVRLLDDGLPFEDTHDKHGTITEDFLAPRDVILRLCSIYFTRVQQRLIQLNESSAQPYMKILDVNILDDKCHTRLAEIALSLLKLVTEDSFFVKCPGFIMYLTEMMPNVNWSDEDNRPILYMILKRLDRLFTKVKHLSELSRKKLNWNGLKAIIAGLKNMITRQPVVSVVPSTKIIVSVNLEMLVGCSTLVATDATDPCVGQAILQLTTAFLSAIRPDITLQELAKSVSQGKRDFVILNLFIPLSINAAALFSRKATNDFTADKCAIQESDVMYMFDYAFDILSKDSKSLPNNISHLLLFASAVSTTRTTLSHKIALLLLKVLITCFHAHLQRHWFKIATSIQKVVMQRSSVPDTRLLIDFLLSVDTPLILYLRPFVLTQMPKIKADYYQAGHLLDLLKRKALNINVERINAADYSFDFEQKVSHLKAEIAAANAPGSKQKHLDKSSKEKKSTRQSTMQPGTSHASSADASKRCHVSNAACENWEATAHGDGLTRFRKIVLRRRSTQKQPATSRSLLAKTEIKRHSVSTTEDTRARKNQEVEILLRERTTSFVAVPTFAVRDSRPSFNSPTTESKCRSVITASDDSLDNDTTSLNDDVFYIEQEKKSSFASKSPDRAKQIRYYYNFADGVENADHSHILIPDTVVTEPTPPRNRRSNSVAAKASPSDSKARSRSRDRQMSESVVGWPLWDGGDE